MAKQLRFEDLPDLLTPTELSEYLRCGRNQAYGLIKTLGSIRIGKKILVPKSLLERFLAGHTQG